MDKQQRRKFSPEIRERAVRLAIEHRGDHASQRAAIVSIAAKIGCTAQTLHNWVRQAERDQGVRGGTTTDDHERMKAWSARAGSFARPTRSCARPARILPRRSSTAGSRHDRLHRRSSRRPWGRADLPRAADRPVDLSRSSRAPRRSRKGAGAGATRHGAMREGRARLRRELSGLWRPQGLATACTGGRGCGAVHGRKADEDDGSSGRHTRKTRKDDDQR